jgi:hypothetical protein
MSWPVEVAVSGRAGEQLQWPAAQDYASAVLDQQVRKRGDVVTWVRTAVVLLTLLTASTAAAATYYIDATGGSDKAAGTTIGTAWQTVAKVNQTSKAPGDFFLFKRGEHFRGRLDVGASSGAPGEPITFGAYGTGNAPILTPATVVAGVWTSAGSNRWTIVATVEPTQIFFDNTRGARRATAAAVTAVNNWHWASNTLTVYSTYDPSLAFVAPGVEHDGGGNVGAITAYNRDYLTFSDLHVTKAAYGVWIAGAGSFTVVENVEADWCFYDGISFLAGSLHGSVTNSASHDNLRNGLSFFDGANYGRVTGGSYYNNAPGSSTVSAAGVGVVFYRAADALVAGVIAYNNTYGFKAFDPATERIVFRDSIAYANTVFGFNLDFIGPGGVVEYCVAYDNLTHQIAIEGTTPGAIIRYNRVYDGRAGDGLAGIELYTTTDTQIYSNIICNQTNGIGLYVSPVRPFIFDNTIFKIREAGINISFENASITGVVLLNNTVSAVGNYLITTGGYTIEDFTSNYNTWYSAGASKMFYNGRVTDLAGWRAATSQDAGANDVEPPLMTPLMTAVMPTCG